jgi:hypothetical protein
MTQALVPIPDPSQQRPGILARIFRATETYNEVERMKAEHALARLAVELDVDLIRHRRKAQHYLEVTALEDRAAKEMAKVIRRRDLLQEIDDLFYDDVMSASVLRARVRAIFNGRNGHHSHCGRRRNREEA